MSTLPRADVSFEQFLEDPQIPERAEWVDGMVVPMHAVDDRHDEVVGWLREAVGVFIRRRLGRFGEPFLMKLPGESSARSPDLFFVASEHLDRVRPRHLAGPADLVIEVVSPESRFRDAVHKVAEYERGGVPEYWLIDPERESATFYRLGSNGRFAAAEPTGGVYRTALLPDLHIDPAWLWQRPLPDPIDLLRSWNAL